MWNIDLSTYNTEDLKGRTQKVLILGSLSVLIFLGARIAKMISKELPLSTIFDVYDTVYLLGIMVFLFDYVSMRKEVKRRMQFINQTEHS